VTASPAFPPRLAPNWRARLTSRLDQPPVRPRADLWLTTEDGPVLIGSIDAELASRMVRARLPVAENGRGWCITPEGGEAADESLARIALWLREQGWAGAWRDELLDVFELAAPGRTRVARIERATVRPLGIATHAAHLVARQEGGRVWVQQRSLSKSTDPGLWDTTVGGLVAAGESLDQALARETWEEAGLRIEEFQSLNLFGQALVRRPTQRGYFIEHIDMFAASLTGGQEPVNQDGEVARFECLDTEALVARLQAGDFTLEAAMVLCHWLDEHGVS
jgi:8-oxo-dGTP pyrophosphatase MutT (NUDIX family)